MGRQDNSTEWCRDIVESIAIAPVYVTGLGPIVVSNGSVHIALTSEQCRIDGSGMEHVLVARLVIPSEIFVSINTKAADQVSVLMEQKLLCMN